MVNLFDIRKRMLQRSLDRQKVKTAKFNVKRKKIREIEVLNRKIKTQKTSRKLTTTQIATRRKIKNNTRKALVGFGKFVKAAGKEFSKKPKKGRGKSRKSAADSFFD